MPRLLSVNVGKPKDVSYHGRTVHTGIWKEPVDGPVTARRINLDGDGQGDLQGHGGEQRAVMVYQAESIAYWREQLGRGDSDDFGYGVFGENFTVEGLADDEVCIGDRYRIGGAEFEVTQPRVTCYRVGLRVDEPKMPSLLVQHHRPGFYLRVITEGSVRAGDEIVRTRRGPHELTVAEIDALLYLPHRNRGRIADALDIPALSPGWRQAFEDMLKDEGESGAGGQGADAPSAAEADSGGWSGFRPLRVEEVVRESSTIISVYLAPQDGEALPAPKPGQYLTLRVPGAGDPPPVRSYSLSSAPGGDTYRISVKREGVVSGYLHTKVHPGSSIYSAAPRGDFVLELGTGPVLLMSAGVGITPVLAMLHKLAADRSDRQVWWVHSAHNSDEQAFAREAHELLSALPVARELVFHTESDTSSDTSPVPVTHARISAEVLAGLGLSPDASAYICGPERFMTDMTKALIDLGLDQGAVHTELFGALDAINPGMAAADRVPPHPPEGKPGAGPMINFVRSGLSVPWNEADAPTLLEFAEACDVPTRWSCRTGVCHTCVTPLLSGETTYEPEPLEPPESGQLLICCSRPVSDVVLDM